MAASYDRSSAVSTFAAALALIALRRRPSAARAFCRLARAGLVLPAARKPSEASSLSLAMPRL
jgi:hypothetical protein